jgi:ketose-bisphosphate aldolase
MKLTAMAPMLVEAKKGGFGIGAFNCVNYATIEAVVIAAREEQSPLIIQTSPSTVKQLGCVALYNMVTAATEDHPYPVVLHLDHCHDLEMIRNCIETGWTSVLIDASHLPLEENIAVTREVVQMAHPAGVTVEGELGAIGGVEDDLVVAEEDAYTAVPQDAKRFIEESGADVLAPAIGTAHGKYKKEPEIAWEAVEEIQSIMEQPFVIHGGTGLDDDTFRRLIKLGGAKVNISTDVKYTYIDGFVNYYNSNPDEYNPLKVIKAARESVTTMARRYMKLFGSSGRCE